MLPITIFETDKAGNLTLCNRHGLELFGYSREDVDRGLNARDFLIEEEHGRTAANIKKVLGGKQIGVNEYTALTKNGKEIPILLRTSRIMEKGKVVGLRGFSIDVSELKKAQNALKKAYAEMETKVAERTKELKAKTEELLEVNTALRVLLPEQQTHRKDIEDRIRLNAGELVLPS